MLFKIHHPFVRCSQSLCVDFPYPYRAHIEHFSFFETSLLLMYFPVNNLNSFDFDLKFLKLYYVNTFRACFALQLRRQKLLKNFNLLTLKVRIYSVILQLLTPV